MRRKTWELVKMSILPLCVLAVLGACGKSDLPDLSPPPTPAGPTPTPMPVEFGSKSQPIAATPAPVSTPEPTATPLALAITIDACSLVTKAEVEAAISHKVLAPEKDQAANIFACYYGDPDAPVEDGRPTSQIVTVSVFAAPPGGEMRDGVAAPARDAFEAAKKNAASVQAITDFKDEAYWDEVLRSIHILRGNYAIEINISSETVELPAAKKLAAKILERLP